MVTQLVKKPPAMWNIWVLSLGWEDPLEKGTATLSSILAWRVPWILWGCKESDTTEWFSLTTGKGTALSKTGTLPHLPQEPVGRLMRCRRAAAAPILAASFPGPLLPWPPSHLLPSNKPVPPLRQLLLTPPGWLQADCGLLTRQVPGTPGLSGATGSVPRRGLCPPLPSWTSSTCPHWCLSPGGNAETLRRFGDSSPFFQLWGGTRMSDCPFILPRIPKGNSRIIRKFS